jgi:hypothetical protein
MPNRCRRYSITKAIVSEMKMPELTPLIIWKTNAHPRPDENGSGKFASLHVAADTVNTRWIRKTAPGHGDTRPTSI